MIRILIMLTFLISIAFAELRIQFNTPKRDLNMACENMVIGVINTVIDQQRIGKRCSINIAMYSLDNLNIINRLTTAINSGVQIKLFLDQGQYKKVLENEQKKRIIEPFVNLVTRNRASVCHVLGVPYDKGEQRQTRILHEKMALFSCEYNKDSEEPVKKSAATEVEEGETYHSHPTDIAVLGSFNWTSAASFNNYENCLSIQNEPEVIDAIKARFAFLEEEPHNAQQKRSCNTILNSFAAAESRKKVAVDASSLGKSETERGEEEDVREDNDEK